MRRPTLTGMASTAELLQLWETTSQEVLAVVRELTDEEWERPTALPGWSVGDVAAHLAHLESEAAGMPQPAGGRVETAGEGGSRPMPTEVTEAGVAARRGVAREVVMTELEQACARRREVLAPLAEADLKDLAPGLVGDLGWDLRTWLTNRSVDLWVHEQDLRRATGRAVVTGSAGAAHTASVLTRAFPYALRRQAPGATVVLRVAGAQARTLAARVGEDRRAAPLTEEQTRSVEPDVTIDLDDATWLLLGSGRVHPAEVDVTLSGDEGLGGEVLGRLDVMP